MTSRRIFVGSVQGETVELVDRASFRRRADITGNITHDGTPAPTRGRHHGRKWSVG